MKRVSETVRQFTSLLQSVAYSPNVGLHRNRNLHCRVEGFRPVRGRIFLSFQCGGILIPEEDVIDDDDKDILKEDDDSDADDKELDDLPQVHPSPRILRSQPGLLEVVDILSKGTVIVVATVVLLLTGIVRGLLVVPLCRITSLVPGPDVAPVHAEHGHAGEDVFLPGSYHMFLRNVGEYPQLPDELLDQREEIDEWDQSHLFMVHPGGEKDVLYINKNITRGYSGYYQLI